MSAEAAILWAVVTPLIGSIFIAATGDRPNVRETVTLVTAALTFLFVASIVPAVAGGGRPAVTVLEMIPGLAIAFGVEPIGMTFALVASFLWIVTSIYSIGYMRGHDEKNQTRFYVFFAVSIFSAIGVAFSGNLLTLFSFYEVLSLCTYPLVTHHGTDEAKRAGRTYLGVLIGTSISFLLLAIVWTYLVAGTLDFTKGGILAGKAEGPIAGVLLALYVFGIGKAAVMPFHRWLPAAMVAPTPVSALLHAVAVVKAGVFSVLKVAVYIFGIDFIAGLTANAWLQAAAALTIILASLVALTKDNLKARLAYSTVSQLSYIVMGAMLGTSLGALGGAMHIATHAFGKITLFFCAGAVLVAAHKTEISQMRGLGRAMPITFACFFIASLSIIGLPPFGGLWSKWFLGLGALEAGNELLVAVLMVSSLLNIAYLIPIPVQAFFAKPAPEPVMAMASCTDNPGHGNPGHDNPGHDNPGHGSRSAIHEAPLPCLVAIVVSTAGCVALFFYSDALYDLLLQVVKP
jgi:multicomponent Na+:H+ antiporter subunit D